VNSSIVGGDIAVSAETLDEDDDDEDDDEID
jgi:hypothetical protein